MTRQVKIGLTGGIATGKSTVLRRWQERGAHGVEADQLAHDTLAPGTATWTEVVRVFGDAVVNPDRTINRRALGDIVFNNEPQRLALNRIVHPAVRQLWTRWLQEQAATAPDAPAVVAIPLLYEVGAETEFDRVVAVGCSEATQLARLTAKGMTADQARARIRAQWPVTQKMERADFVIWNDGLPAGLERQADLLWQILKENAHAA